MLESLFKKVAGLIARNFIKKRPQHNIAKFLRLPISRNICERLLFDCFNDSMLHGPKDWISNFYDGVGLQSPSHRFSFLFLSRHLSSWTESRPAFENLRRIPLMSQLSFCIGYFWSFSMVLGCFSSFLDRFSSFLTLVSASISPYSVRMRENTDQKNSKYRHFYWVRVDAIIDGSWIFQDCQNARLLDMQGVHMVLNMAVMAE